MKVLTATAARSIVGLLALGAAAGCAVAPESTGSASADMNAPVANAGIAFVAEPVAAATLATAAADVDAGGDTCVEPGRYVIEDAVAVDQQNGGRRWQRVLDGERRTEPDAIAYCASLTLGGQGGWRLPTVQELATVKLRPAGLKGGPDTCYPSIDHAAFPDTPSAEFWTSTTRDVGDGMETGFDDGRSHPATLDSAFNVRCVHDGGPTAGAAQ